MAHSGSSQWNKAICLPPLRLFVARAAILLNPDSIVCGKAMCDYARTPVINFPLHKAFKTGSVLQATVFITALRFVMKEGGSHNILQNITKQNFIENMFNS